MRWVLTLLTLVFASGAGAQTISGRVYDQTGAVVSGARVVLLEDFNKITETKSGEKGEFSFRQLKPGTYQVQVKQPRFQIFQQLMSLQENQNAQVYAVLNVARAETEVTITGDPLPGIERQGSGDRTYRRGGKVEGLKRLRGRMPAWPEAAARRGAAGAVVLSATVNTDGGVADITVLESPDPDLEQEAIEAYRTWKYVPMKLDGGPVECREVVVFHFRPGKGQ